jgi:hypothetical protein
MSLALDSRLVDLSGRLDFIHDREDFTGGGGSGPKRHGRRSEVTPRLGVALHILGLLRRPAQITGRRRGLFSVCILLR